MYGVVVGQERTPGNTIRKVYLCRAKITRLRPGDVLFFYVSKDERYEASQSITTIVYSCLRPWLWVRVGLALGKTEIKAPGMPKELSLRNELGAEVRAQAFDAAFDQSSARLVTTSE